MFNRSSSADAEFCLLTGWIAAVCLWLVLTPIMPTIASASMHRFHLRSRSFLIWAIQFPIPTMYNFANQYSVRKIPTGLVDPIADETTQRYINHFPARVVTFFNTRYLHLQEGSDRWFTINSSYRGQRLETKMHLQPLTHGNGFRLHRHDGGDQSR